MAVVLKSPEELERMRIAGRLASEVLDFIAPHVRPGVTTGKLNDLCHDYMVNVQGTVPAPLNYAPPGYPPYPKSVCTSVNQVVCHGVPGGKRLKDGDIGHAIQSHAEAHGFSVVREFCGHGIGRRFHEEPQVLHYGRPQTGMKLQAGMIFTVEPMINAGKAGIRQLADGWTIVTKDHSLSAQWEHTVLVSETGFEILTLSSGSPQPAALAA